MIVRARQTTMDLNPVLAPDALPTLPDLVEIAALKPACAMLTPTEKQPPQQLMRVSPPGRQVNAKNAWVAPLIRKQVLVQQPPRVQTALAKPATTLMELKAHALDAPLVIRQIVKRKLQQQQQ